MDPIDHLNVDVTSARLIDELAAAATPSPLDRDLGGWRAKAAPDLPFRRCNAVLPPISSVGEPGGSADVGRIVDAIERWYASLGQRVIVTVSAADPGADDLDRYLASRGYRYEAPVHVMVRDVGQRDRGEGTTAGADLDDDGGLTLAVVVGLDEEWAQRYAVAHGGDRSARQRTESYGRMLTVLGSDALGASAVLDGEVAGVGFGVVDRGHLGIFGMGTAARFRRRGVASAVVEALLATAVERSATRAYLQVETDNAAAIDLYQRLGFTRSHDYHYRVSAPPA